MKYLPSNSLLLCSVKVAKNRINIVNSVHYILKDAGLVLHVLFAQCRILSLQSLASFTMVSVAEVQSSKNNFCLFGKSVFSPL